MSEFIIVATEEKALREKEKFEGTKSLEFKISELDKKLQKINRYQYKHIKERK